MRLPLRPFLSFRACSARQLSASRSAWVSAFKPGRCPCGGGLVFDGDVNGRFRAFDDQTGEILWEINLGSPVSGFPITYAVDGRQYVAISTGYGRFLELTPELRPSANNNLFIFTLPE